MTIQRVSDYRFCLEDLRVGQRKEGISAFMRVKNGEDFLRVTVLSHIDFFDEIVIVFNDCQDSTEEIVERLVSQYPEKIKAYHYLNKIAPPGVVDNALDTLANYYNFALAKTNYTVAVKLDDDHIAIASNLKRIVQRIRQQGCRLPNQMWCFSGLNIFNAGEGFGVLKHEPFSGSGDIGFFEVTQETVFYQTKKFEAFNRKGLTRSYCGMAYLHLKYIKKGNGFINYELDKNPDSRYARKKQRFDKIAQEESFSAFLNKCKYFKPLRFLANLLPSKLSIKLLRRATLCNEIGAKAEKLKPVLEKWLG